MPDIESQEPPPKSPTGDPKKPAAASFEILLPTVPKGGGQKSLGAIANLANLLPTGTILIFEALVSSFSNNGNCRLVHLIFTSIAIGFCTFLCLFSCFTDSFISKNDGQLYYGIATRNGFYVFNDMDSTDDSGNEELKEDDKKKYKLKRVDFLHAVLSAAVFLAFAFSSDVVEKCLFSHPGPDWKEFINKLLLAISVFVSFLFAIFPSKRKGIGYAGRAPQ